MTRILSVGTGINAICKHAHAGQFWWRARMSGRKPVGGIGLQSLIPYPIFVALMALEATAMLFLTGYCAPAWARM